MPIFDIYQYMDVMYYIGFLFFFPLNQTLENKIFSARVKHYKMFFVKYFMIKKYFRSNKHIRSL